MKRTATVVAAVLVIVVAAPASGSPAQERPNFSGAWQASAAAGGRGRGPTDSMGSGWGSTITITQDASTLTVERVFFSPGDLQPALKFRYALDGTETVNTVMMGRGIQEQVSTTAWDGAALVITIRFTDDEGGQTISSEVTQRLSLRRSASLVQFPSLVVETTRSGALGGPPSTTRTVYTRR